jgi:hypothetical protein
MMGGTVQKKLARAKQFLFIQHTQNFRASLARVASAMTTQSSIGEKRFEKRKDFSGGSFQAVEIAMREARWWDARGSSTKSSARQLEEIFVTETRRARRKNML